MQEATVNGTILPDGTLQLNERLPLPPGEVQVVVRSSPAKDSGLMETLQHIWSEAERLGLQPRSAQEIDAEIEAIRQSAAEEIGEFMRGSPNSSGQLG